MTHPLSCPAPLPPVDRRRRRAVALATAALLTALGVSTGVARTASAAPPAGLVTTWGYGSPVSPAALGTEGATQVDAGSAHSLALTPDGHVVAWGDDEAGGTDVPESLADKTVTAVSAGGGHSLALTSDGEVTAWGYGEWGEGDSPASLQGKEVTAVSAGGTHNLALTSDGHVTAWGDPEYGATDVPASLADKTVTAISAGQHVSLALTSDGQVTAWGLSDDSLGGVPASLTGKTVTAISAGVLTNLALTSDGKVIAWGDDAHGQTDVPASLADKTVVAVSAGMFYSLALTSDGRVTAWGDDSYDQTDMPASLSDQSVTAISAGGLIGVALVRGTTPEVTSSPLSEDVPLGTAASFSASASSRPAPTVQWQRADPGGAFADVPGATSTTYTFTPVVTDDGATFRAVFTSSGGTTTTGAARLSIADHRPSAEDLDVTTGFETATPVLLSGSDPDGDALTYTIADPPAHGTLTGTAPAVTYTPAAGFSGVDTFTYRVDDGRRITPAATVRVTVSPRSCVASAPERQLQVDTGERDRDGVVRSPKLTTARPGELLVAFVAANGPAKGGQAVTKVTGGGLTWTRVQRDRTARGTSEVWQAYASKKLGSTRVTARLAKHGYSVTLTVAAFTGARPTVGSAAHRAGARSAPRVSLTPQAPGSVVWAVGRVVGSRYRPVPAPGQDVVHRQTFRSPSTGYWTQRTTAATASATPVTLSDRATARTWGYTAVEIRSACG